MTIPFANARWFGGKGRGGSLTSMVERLSLAGVTVCEAFFSYPDSSSESYFVWLTGDGQLAFSDLSLIGPALVDAGLAEPGQPVERLPETQSNTLFRCGDRIIKVYRRPHGGGREVAALTATADSEATPHLLAVCSASDQVFGIATERFSGRSAWDLAILGQPLDPTSIFAALVDVHDCLARLGTGVIAGEVVAHRLWNRITQAQEAVGDLAAELETLRRFGNPLIDKVFPTQTVHGDFHLGQVLIDDQQVRIIDFEGIPGSLENTFDTPMVDQAGLLRSFDYVDQKSNSSRYAKDATKALITRYRRITTQTLLAALYADRAVYELLYETRTRPDWAFIPRRAIVCLASKEEPWHSISREA